MLRRLLVPEKFLNPLSSIEILDFYAVEYLPSLFSWGLYTEDELPNVAVEAADISGYIGGVSTGGHQYYLDAVKQQARDVTNVFRSIKDGLDAVNASDFLENFEGFLEFANDKKKSEQTSGSWGFGTIDDLISKCDEAFHKCDVSQLTNDTCHRLLNYQSIDGIDYMRKSQEVAAQIRSNPEIGDRIESMQDPNRSALKENPIYMKLVEALAHHEICVDWPILPGDWSVIRSQKGWQGVHLETNQGWVLASHSGSVITQSFGPDYVALGMPDRVVLVETS